MAGETIGLIFRMQVIDNSANCFAATGQTDPAGLTAGANIEFIVRIGFQTGDIIFGSGSAAAVNEIFLSTDADKNIVAFRVDAEPLKVDRIERWGYAADINVADIK